MTPLAAFGVAMALFHVLRGRLQDDVHVPWPCLRLFLRPEPWLVLCRPTTT